MQVHANNNMTELESEPNFDIDTFVTHGKPCNFHVMKYDKEFYKKTVFEDSLPK